MIKLKISLKPGWKACLVLSVYLFFATITGLAGDMDTVEARLFENDRAGNLGSASSVSSWLASMQADGSWPDIDYAPATDANWAPVTHLHRLLSMAATYQTGSSSLYHDAGLLAGIQKGLDYWIIRKPKSNNWWWNDIGAPEPLGAMLLLMRADLTPDSISQAVELMSAEPKLTGQNRVWISNVVIHRGLVEGNQARFESGVEGIKSTIVIDPDVGIQVDGSFYQHGKFLYNGGYGLGYLIDVSLWAALLRETGYAISGEAGDTLARLILDGTGWMIRYRTVDYSCMGREISRKNQTGKANRLLAPLNQMIQANDAHQAGYQALLDHISNRSPEYPYAAGEKHFWRTDYTVLRNPEFLVTLNMFSTRTVGGESINNENLKGLYLPFGTTLIYRNGDEYDNIMPVWDWRRLPGTTTEQLAVEPIGLTNGIGQSSFVGGVSNGTFGMSAFDLFDDASRVTARKSWFFFPDGFMALGADIRCTSDRPVFTSVNQCRRDLYPLDTQYNGSTSTISTGDHSLENTDWVINNGVGYLFPQHDTVFISNGTQSGTWNSINAQYSTSTVASLVFAIGIDHGDVSQIPGSYQYCVLPVGDKEKITAFAADNPLQVLANSRQLQAVRHSSEGVTGITFFEPGSIEIEPGLKVRAESPCLVLVNSPVDGATLEISVADPTTTTSELILEVSNHLDGPEATYLADSGTSRLTFSLPEGMYAGSSVTQSYYRRN